MRHLQRLDVAKEEPRVLAAEDLPHAQLAEVVDGHHSEVVEEFLLGRSQLD